MQLAANAAQMMTGVGIFCSLREKISEIMQHAAGKILLVAEEAAFPAVAFAVRMPRVVSAVTADALPLFAMPETSVVLGVGGENVMRAARLYASVRKAACVLFPTDPQLDGVYGEGAIVNGMRLDFPLSDGEVCFDETLLYPSIANAYARLLLNRLALFEAWAKSRFDGGEPPQEPYRILMDLDISDRREILLKNAALRRMGAPDGEGKILARREGNFAAFEALTELYVAFFRHGSPRKYAAVDYEGRAKAAGIPYADMHIPTVEEFAHRALVLDGRRGEFLRELDLITRKSATYRRIYRSLGGEVRRAVENVRLLPELSGGLSEIIRDFGLLEKL